MPAELVSQRGVHLGRKRVLAAGREPLVQRGADDRRRDALVDGVLNGPAALAGVLHPGLESLEIVALHLEGPRGQLAEPRADHRALHPQMRDLGVVQLVFAGVEQREPLRVRLHHPVLHAVMDHLHVVAGAGRAEVAPARSVLVVLGRGEHVEDGPKPLDRLVVASDHHAVADLKAPHSAAHTDVDVVDALRRQRLLAALVVAPARVPAVDDRVALVEEIGQMLDGLLGGIAGGHHDPDRTRRVELRHEILERRRSGGAVALGLPHGVLAHVEHDALVLGVAVDPMDHVAAHLAETD
jgi:hypothetical protein